MVKKNNEGKDGGGRNGDNDNYITGTLITALKQR